MVKYLKYLTDSDKETIKLGQRLGSLLSEGDVVALVGDLGSGKTWFTKGLALGLGVDQNTVVTSPSFALVNEYEGRYTLYHMDLYRLEDLADVLSTGLEEYLHEEGVVVMEWADRWPEILPERCVRVEISILDDRQRDITLSGRHAHAKEIMKSINQEIIED